MCPLCCKIQLGAVIETSSNYQYSLLLFQCKALVFESNMVTITIRKADIGKANTIGSITVHGNLDINTSFPINALLIPSATASFLCKNVRQKVLAASPPIILMYAAFAVALFQ